MLTSALLAVRGLQRVLRCRKNEENRFGDEGEMEGQKRMEEKRRMEGIS